MTRCPVLLVPVCTAEGNGLLGGALVWSCHRAGRRGTLEGTREKQAAQREGQRLIYLFAVRLPPQAGKAVKTAQRGFPRRGEQEKDGREAVRQRTPSGGCAGMGPQRSQARSEERWEPGSPETPGSSSGCARGLLHAPGQTVLRA